MNGSPFLFYTFYGPRPSLCDRTNLLDQIKCKRKESRNLCSSENECTVDWHVITHPSTVNQFSEESEATRTSRTTMTLCRFAVESFESWMSRCAFAVPLFGHQHTRNRKDIDAQLQGTASLFFARSAHFLQSWTGCKSTATRPVIWVQDLGK